MSLAISVLSLSRLHASITSHHREPLHAQPDIEAHPLSTLTSSTGGTALYNPLQRPKSSTKIRSPAPLPFRAFDSAWP
ncbi:hypothetical protein CCHR01_02854 [Colletotrichum chrysophilum]|uniref:Uncharacterized protein n=1 Tax=Colletotrichum chrysophilum TaxID=1836956 RepID=A0AAD9EJW9_9PEZI|nr:hypothetical protein CCHR01_02854 [Colletotrichum chrysophilum]